MKLAMVGALLVSGFVVASGAIAHADAATPKRWYWTEGLAAGLSFPGARGGRGGGGGAWLGGVGGGVVGFISAARRGRLRHDLPRGRYAAVHFAS